MLLPLTSLVGFGAGGGAGDLLIVIFAVDGNPTVTWGGTGFTEFFQDANGNNATLALAYRQVDGTEGSSIEVTTSPAEGSGHIVYRIKGHEVPSKQAPEVSVKATGLSESPDPDSLTPTGGAKNYLWLAVHGVDRNRSTDTFPTNYVNGISNQVADGDGASPGSAERALNASSENPGAFTVSTSDQWIAATIAIHPLGGGGFPTVVNTATSDESSSDVTSHTVNLPA